MKVHVWCDERYPDYGVSNNLGTERIVEITDEFYAEVQAVNAAYDAMQDKLEALRKEQEAA